MSDPADRPTRQLDTTGTFCPLPILLAAREMLRMAVGERLEIVGDDPAILEDMPVWCERAGHGLIEMARRGGKIVSLVEKGGAARHSPPGDRPPGRPPRREAGGGRGRAAGGDDGGRGRAIGSGGGGRGTSGGGRAARGGGRAAGRGGRRGARTGPTRPKT